MVGVITQSSSLNSFSSICYCFIVLGVHAYSCHTAISRYKEAESRAWPGGGGTPVESGTLLGLTILSLILMPLFCVTCFIKVGNFANDGVKLGRDHALGSTSLTETENSGKYPWISRIWKHFCPISQTLHLMAAFFLLLPETLLTAVEIKFGYKATHSAWQSNLDFLFPPDRAFLSDIRSSVNVTLYTNATRVILPTPRVPADGWGDHLTVSIIFVNFCLALTCFLVRYASVFWYTNKPLTVIFALQLLAMVLNSIFSFSSFSTLYCVCYNQGMFPNVTLALGCGADLVLYLIGSTILMLSTMTVFEYGSHYFHQKFQVVERHHKPESYVKQTVIVNSGCQGYVPHSCAMAALIVFAVCKGPLLFDLVSLMRLTKDELLLSGIICEVCYMVLWLALWFGLTVKQQWQFRILDYVPLRQSIYAMPADSVVRNNHSGQGDSIQGDSLTRNKRLSGRENFQQRFQDPAVSGTNSSCEDPCHSDHGTDESDIINNTVEMVVDLDGNPMTDSNLRRSRNRRNGGQRVTFDESIRRQRLAAQDSSQTPTNSLPRQNVDGCHRQEEANHLVTADVHSSNPSSSNSSNESSQDVVLRRKSTGPDVTLASREYRNSIRSKCGEYYSSTNNLSSSTDEPIMGSSPPEPLPTLMSSFRDKVRESSIAASNFRERERHMREDFDYTDPIPPPVVDDIENNDAEKRKCIAISDEDIGLVGQDTRLSVGNYTPGDGVSEKYYRYDDNVNPNNYRHSGNLDDLHYRQCAEKRVGKEDFDYSSNVNNPLTRKAQQHNSSVSSDEGHRSSFANSTIESSDLSLPPLLEDLQLGKVRNGSSSAHNDDYPPNHPHHHQHHNMVGGKLDPRSIHIRPLHVVVGGKKEMGRRDSANYSLTSSQENSSNESDHGQGLCSQV